VYTLGNIGAHRIVCTKLPTVGHTREAMTAAGNTTTRLLGMYLALNFLFYIIVRDHIIRIHYIFFIIFLFLIIRFTLYYH